DAVVDSDKGRSDWRRRCRLYHRQFGVPTEGQEREGHRAPRSVCDDLEEAVRRLLESRVRHRLQPAVAVTPGAFASREPVRLTATVASAGRYQSLQSGSRAG